MTNLRAQKIYVFEDFRLDAPHLLLYRNEQEISLAPKVIETLLALVERRGEVFSKDELMEIVWPDSVVEEGNLSQNLYLLRKTLGKTAAGKPFIETLHRRGYRFNGDVACGESKTTATFPPDSATSKTKSDPHHLKPRDLTQMTSRPDPIDMLQPPVGAVGSDPRKASSAGYMVGGIRQHKRAATAAAAVMLAAVIGLGYFLFSSRPTINVPQIGSIAVMPFANESGNADIDYLSDGLTETLISSLSQLQNLDVKAHSSVIRYKGKETSANSIARELNVQAFLNGKVRQRGGDLSLYVELVDAASEKAIWSQTYDRPMSNLVVLQREIAHDVAGKLRSRLSGEDEQRLAKRTTANPEAYRLLMLGNYHVGKRKETEILRGIEYFEKAIALDQNYAAPYAGLAAAYIVLPNYSKVPFPEVMPKIKDATLKALALDNDLAEAHTSLGFIMQNTGDLAAAEREYKRAIELNPNSSMAYHFYSQYYRMGGKLEEAVELQRRAVEIDPLSLIVNREYGNKLYVARRYDDAIEQLKKTIELDPSFASAHYSLAVVHWAKGNHAEAVEGHAKYQELINEPAKAGLLRENFAKGGWLAFLQTITDESKQFDLAWNGLAPYYAAMGEKDKAFAELSNRFANRRVRPGPLMDPTLFAAIPDSTIFSEGQSRNSGPRSNSS